MLKNLRGVYIPQKPNDFENLLRIRDTAKNVNDGREIKCNEIRLLSKQFVYQESEEITVEKSRTLR